MTSEFRRDFLKEHPWTQTPRKRTAKPPKPCARCGFIHRAGIKLCANENARIYVIKTAEFVKVGITTGIKQRLAGLQNSCPLPLTVEYLTGPMAWVDALQIEQRVHASFQDCHVRGEWFRTSPEKAIERIMEVSLQIEKAPESSFLSLSTAA